MYIPECNLLHDIQNISKQKYINRHYPTTLHGCMNTKMGRFKFKIFLIVFNSRYKSENITIRLIIKLKTKEYDVMQWHKKAGSITTTLKVNIYVTLPEFSAIENMMWEYHVDESAKGRYNMFLGKDIFT